MRSITISERMHVTMVLINNGVSNSDVPQTRLSHTKTKTTPMNLSVLRIQAHVSNIHAHALSSTKHQYPNIIPIRDVSDVRNRTDRAQSRHIRRCGTPRSIGADEILSGAQWFPMFVAQLVGVSARPTPIIHPAPSIQYPAPCTMYHALESYIPFSQASQGTLMT